MFGSRYCAFELNQQGQSHERFNRAMVENRSITKVFLPRSYSNLLLKNVCQKRLYGWDRLYSFITLIKKLINYLYTFKFQFVIILSCGYYEYFFMCVFKKPVTFIVHSEILGYIENDSNWFLRTLYRFVYMSALHQKIFINRDAFELARDLGFKRIIYMPHPLFDQL